MCVLVCVWPECWHEGGRLGEILIKVWDKEVICHTPPPLHTYLIHTHLHVHTMHCFLSFPLLSLIPSPQLDDFSMKGFFINPTSGNRCSPTSHTHTHTKHARMHNTHIDLPLRVTLMYQRTCTLNTKLGSSFFMIPKMLHIQYKGTHNAYTHQCTHKPLISVCK